AVVNDLDQSQGQRASVTHCGVRLPHGPQAQARRKRVEEPAQGQSKVGTADACKDRPVSRPDIPQAVSIARSPQANAYVLFTPNQKADNYESEWNCRP